MKSVLQAEDTEGERHISISTLLIFNTIFSRNCKAGSHVHAVTEYLLLYFTILYA